LAGCARVEAAGKSKIVVEFTDRPLDAQIAIPSASGSERHKLSLSPEKSEKLGHGFNPERLRPPKGSAVPRKTAKIHTFFGRSMPASHKKHRDRSAKAIFAPGHVRRNNGLDETDLLFADWLDSYLPLSENPKNRTEGEINDHSR
jgi:hypothetical protein